MSILILHFEDLSKSVFKNHRFLKVKVKLIFINGLTFFIKLNEGRCELQLKINSVIKWLSFKLWFIWIIS